MLRALHGEAELHVMVAPIWRNTGLEMQHVEPLADLPGLHWHIVVPDNPLQLRVEGHDVEGLLDTVRTIDPDLTLARSADTATPALFPGTVRYIMEQAAEPLKAPAGWFVLDEMPFHHGMMPDDAAVLAEFAAQAIAPTWRKVEARYARPGRDALRAALGLPQDRPVLAVPLQYEHPENIFGYGTPFEFGPQLIEALLAHLDPRIVLGVADHPLNARHLMRGELDRLAAAHPERMRLCRQDEALGSPTGRLIRAADAVLIDQSKCITNAIFFGTPIVQVGASRMADWLHATPIGELTADALAQRGLPAADPVMARRWFGWHHGMRLINPGTVTLETLLKRVEGRADEAGITQILDAIAPWFKVAARLEDEPAISGAQAA